MKHLRIPPQSQDEQPGQQRAMHPEPQSRMEHYLAASKLKGKRALVTGGDSGIGRAVAIGFAKEGADVMICHTDQEHKDAAETRRLIEAEGVRCHSLSGDIGDQDFCRQAVESAVETFGGLDILVNNAAEQHVQEDFEDISSDQLERTFRTNIFGIFYLIQAALPYLEKGSAIINTASVVAYKGNPKLMDYTATKGSVVSLTRALSQSLAKRGIRVNAVAPGPIWTPLIPASFSASDVAKFGKDTTLGRPGQPDEVAPCYLFLASDDASYMTGQVMHPNGGTVVNG